MQNPKDDYDPSGWTFIEELKLIELWRIYCADIHDFTAQHPIFRRVSDEMRQCGCDTTPNDCRRRMLVMHMKYMQDRCKLIDDDIFSIEWDLFPLIHEIYEDKTEPTNLTILKEEVNEFLEELRSNEQSDTSIPSMASFGPPNESRTSIECMIPSRFNPFKVTATRLLQIREDIGNLKKQRNDDLQRLRLEMREFAILQKVFQNWQTQQENMLKNLQKNLP